MARKPHKDVAGVIMMPPLILLIAIILMVALEFLIPVAFFPAPGLTSWLSWLGLLIAVAGAVSAIAGNREFQRSGTNVSPERPALKLVTSGPYRFTRNPMYLGMLLLVAGLGLMFSLEWVVIVWPAFLAVLHFGVIKREERYLTNKFGDAYRHFLKQTRRYL